MSDKEKQMINDLVRVATQLDADGKKALIRLGNDIIFIDKVKKDAGC